MQGIVHGVKSSDDAFIAFNFGYWAYFGTIKLLDDLNVTKIDIYSKIFSFIALALYMLLANALLMNLLIAMFK